MDSSILCKGSYIDTLNSSEYLFQILGSFLATASLFGFGIFFVSIWNYFVTVKERPSLSVAYIAGISISPLVLQIFSILGWCNIFEPFLWIGCLRFFYYLMFQFFRDKSFLKLSPKLFLDFSICFIFILFAIRIISYPLPEGDTTAIWGLQAKHLCCSCFLDSIIQTQPHFTGSHPEYPQAVSFLRAFYFKSMNSFRDDLVDMYQSFFLVIVGMTLWNFGKKIFGNLWIALFLVLHLMILVSLNPGLNLLFLRLIELQVVCYMVLILIAFYQKNRILIFLSCLGLSNTKKEGMIFSMIFLALYSVDCFSNNLQNWQDRFSQFKRNYLPSITGIVVLWLLGKLQPSLHEQYEKNIFSFSAWSNGIKGLEEILQINTEIFLKNSYWWFVFGLSLVLWVVVSIYFVFLKPSPKFKSSSRILTINSLSTISFFIIYLGILIVSPWGPKLSKIVTERYFLELAFVGIFSVAIVFHLLMKNIKSYWYPIIIVAFFSTINFFNLYSAITESFTVIQSRWYRDQWSLEVFTDPKGYFGSNTRKKMLDIDYQLPKSKVLIGIFGESYYYSYNYFLFPRIVYAASPETIAGGSSYKWVEYKTLDEIVKNQDWKYVIDGKTMKVYHLGKDEDDNLNK